MWVPAELISKERETLGRDTPGLPGVGLPAHQGQQQAGGDQPNRGVAQTIGRFIGHGLWILLPVISLGFLAWLPATQGYWRARTPGWLITMLVFLLGMVAFVVGLAIDRVGLWVAAWFAMVPGGVVAAALARKVVFGRADKVDPAIHAVVEGRRLRDRAREIVKRDPAMALELRIGRPDLARDYDDGGLVDLNNVTPDVIVSVLSWSSEAAESFVAGRDQRAGYTSPAEMGALSGVDPQVFERDADRIIVLPFRPGDRRP